MPVQRKLGRATDQRKAMLRGLVTALFQNGRIETTEARAKEVKNIAEKLISAAVKEEGNVTKAKQVKVSSAKFDSKGKKITKTVTSQKSSKKYSVVEREIKTEMKVCDTPSRLNVRRKIISNIYKVKDKDGKNIKIANIIFDDLATKYKERNGGYTRIYKLGPRRGDAAEMVILELI